VGEGIAPALFRLEDGCLWSSRPREQKWSRASVQPRVSPRPKRGGLLSPSEEVGGEWWQLVGGRETRGHDRDRVVIKNGGLCGLCSRRGGGRE
jgi:hypothetical protein